MGILGVACNFGISITEVVMGFIAGCFGMKEDVGAIVGKAGFIAGILNDSILGAEGVNVGVAVAGLVKAKLRVCLSGTANFAGWVAVLPATLLGATAEALNAGLPTVMVGLLALGKATELELILGKGPVAWRVSAATEGVVGNDKPG